MHAHKLKVIIPQDHQLEIAVRLPEDFPPGPAEVIVLAGPSGEKFREEVRRDALAVVEELHSLQLTEEEQKILDDFEEFRKKHPFCLASLHNDS